MAAKVDGMSVCLSVSGQIILSMEQWGIWQWTFADDLDKEEKDK